MRGLSVGDALLHPLDFVFDVTVGNEDVGPTIVIVIKEEATEAESNQGCAANFGTRRFVYEQAITLVVIEGKHLICEICNDNAGMAGAVIVGSVHAHTSSRDSIFTESDARSHTTLLEAAIFFVQVKLVRLRVVGQQDVWPAVAVVIENGNTKAF